MKRLLPALAIACGLFTVLAVAAAFAAIWTSGPLQARLTESTVACAGFAFLSFIGALCASEPS
jgi:hypothetical protein